MSQILLKVLVGRYSWWWYLLLFCQISIPFYGKHSGTVYEIKNISWKMFDLGTSKMIIENTGVRGGFK